MHDFSSLAPLFHLRNQRSIFSDLFVTTIGFCDFNRYKDVLRVLRHSHHTIHFILEGEGTYKVDGKAFHLKKNQAFYTPPGKTLSYFPSKNKPWTYVWFAFVGIKSEEFMSRYSISKSYVCTPSNHEAIQRFFERLLTQLNSALLREETILSNFFKFIELLTYDDISAEQKTISIPTYITLAKEFMWANYGNPHLTMQQVAQAIHISHSYLCAIFKQHEGISAKQHLSLSRLKAARDFLVRTDKTITEISALCGYKDPLYFSAAFKKQFNYSPTEYREKFFDPSSILLNSIPNEPHE